MSSDSEPLAPALKAKVDPKLKSLLSLSTAPEIANAVKHYNSALPEDSKNFVNERWKSLSVLDSVVRSYSNKGVGTFLKSRRDHQILEMFVSGAHGCRVVFLSKTTTWSHSGKDKHQFPIAGRVWFGPWELDESTGTQQIQVGLPVPDASKPIGSIVVGLGGSKAAVIRRYKENPK